MRCPRCGFKNPEGLKFCNECGAPLRMPCAQCGFANQPQAKFCGACGAALLPQAGASTAPLRAPRPHTPLSYTPAYLAERIFQFKTAVEGEHKQVTVLFADLKGSMELLADRDPEEARQLLDPVLERMMQAVHRYEGTVNQVMGDGIMALFGAPIAHEDHAVRACYAALAMQTAIRRYSEDLRRTQGLEVQIRVGLNSGEVVVRAIGNDLHMDYTAVGQTTHLAARMEQMALPGTIRLPIETWRLAEGFIEVKPLGPVPVKGLPEPIELYELLRAGPVRTRLQAAAARGLTRFVGRDGELDQLRLALERAGAGQGQVVAVIGEPGIGKSRLFHEFTHSHRLHGWLLLASSSVSYGKATPYLPVIDLLRAYCQIEARDDARRIREKLTGKLLTLDETLLSAFPAFLALLDLPVEDAAWHALDPAQRRQRTLEAVKRLLLRETQMQPLLLIFEDLHWIDAETQAVLDSGRMTEALPLLESAVKSDEAMGLNTGQPLLITWLSEGYLRLHRRQEAAALAGQALDLSRACQERGNEAYALRLLGDIAAHGDPPDMTQGEAHYRQARALAEELGMRPLVAHCHLGRGVLYGKIGRRKQARAELFTALELYRAMDTTLWLPQAEAALAQVEGR
jgi:class 3 adenylate cyclase/tetratricopeptide (TPR) repeat protein